MSPVHWRNLADEERAVLRALRDGGTGTLGEALSRARREGAAGPLYRLMQALTTLVASGLVEADEEPMGAAAPPEPTAPAHAGSPADSHVGIVPCFGRRCPACPTRRRTPGGR